MRKFSSTVLKYAFFLFSCPCPVLRMPIDIECASDFDCPREKACINLECVDPCRLRGACGEGAICRAVLHRARCSCPQCYTGSPQTACTPDPHCATSIRPNSPMLKCRNNKQCPSHLECDSSTNECKDPCIKLKSTCKGNKKCEVRLHKPVCVCKSGFILNELGELTCAPDNAECTQDSQCASNMACIKGECRNPCNIPNSLTCPDGKICEVLDHKQICICVEDCFPSVSICLRDTGCPSNLACRNFQCVDPCINAGCSSDVPCYVEEHKPICKFCPQGFLPDAKYGCLKGKSHNIDSHVWWLVQLS
jgi:hypothetical protein